MINVKIFFQSVCLSWLRRYAFGNGPANKDPSPLEDHWCDLLDDALGIKPNERLSTLNRGSEWLNSKLKVDHPCLSEILRTLQAIQRKWISPQLSHLSSTARHCLYCLDNLVFRVDQTFLHGCLECPNVSKPRQRYGTDIWLH